MISIASPTYDINGHLWIDANPENIYSAKRRGSVTETLDGGVSVYDTGYSVADQTIKCRVKSPSRDLLQRMQYLVAHYAQLVLCCEAGAFMCIPAFSTAIGEASLSLRLVRRLN